MSSYLQLREGLRAHLEGVLPCPVSLHSGSFSAADIEALGTEEGSEVKVVLSAVNAEKATAKLYIKTRASQYATADAQGLDLVIMAQRALDKWKDPLLAKRVKSHWQALEDSHLASLNVYLWLITLEIPIYFEDYIKEYDDV